MILNTVEFVAMNNPLRTAVQRHFEAHRFLTMGGPSAAGRALEIGCGRGIGVDIAFDQFNATEVDAIDLDPRMVKRAQARLANSPRKTRVWVGDATRIDAPDATYDTVFDFGIIHHIPDWRRAVSEVFRVLKPGGRFYAEEVLRNFIVYPLWRMLLDHPQADRFDHDQFKSALSDAGFTVIADKAHWNSFGWYVANKKEEPSA